MRLFAPQFLVVWAFLGSAVAVHFRGKVRLGFWGAGPRPSTLYGLNGFGGARPGSEVCPSQELDPGRLFHVRLIREPNPTDILDFSNRRLVVGVGRDDEV